MLHQKRNMLHTIQKICRCLGNPYFNKNWIFFQKITCHHFLNSIIIKKKAKILECSHKIKKKISYLFVCFICNYLNKFCRNNINYYHVITEYKNLNEIGYISICYRIIQNHKIDINSNDQVEIIICKRYDILQY